MEIITTASSTYLEWPTSFIMSLPYLYHISAMVGLKFTQIRSDAPNEVTNRNNYRDHKYEKIKNSLMEELGSGIDELEYT